MSLNRRVYYANRAVGVQSYDLGGSYTLARGVQSVGITTSFNLEQVFELGQLAIYENIENVPEVEVTMEKVLDGYAPLWTLCTQGATAATLVGRSNQRANIAVGIFPDTNSTASGSQIAQVICSGMYPSQLSHSFTADGNFTESVSLVGNNKLWTTGSFSFNGYTTTGVSPYAPEGVNRRQDFVMASSLFPTDIHGISSSGTNEDTGSGCYTVSVQSIRTSTNLGRQQILELGRFAPYFRYIDFPVETQTAIEVIDKEGEQVSALETGIYSYNRNVLDQQITVVVTEGTRINMGSKNKLQSVSESGGNAARGGGNATLTYNYLGYNEYTVQHPQDPTTGIRP